MSYQLIRGAIEMVTALELNNAGAGYVFYDNVPYTQPGADETFAEINLTFADVKRDVIGCCGNDDVGGTVTVIVSTPVGKGARPGEDIALEVLKVWAITGAFDGYLQNGHVRMRNLDGPRLINGDASSTHQQHTISAAFRGRLA
jgi:hypothetical protein